MPKRSAPFGDRRTLGAGLGVVELTVALHAVFDAPRDKIIWTATSAIRKILTGRRDRIRTLRQRDGLSGSPSGPKAHMTCSGARIPLLHFKALLCRRARPWRRRRGRGRCDRRRVDEAGMAYEAMNNAAIWQAAVVILNDNEMSISRR